MKELSEYVKEEDEEGGEEEGGDDEEREGEEGKERKLTRLVRNRDANSVEEAEEMDVEETVTTTSITPQVCTLSARRLRLQLAEMTEEERREWRTLALRPGTVPYAGTYDTYIRQNSVHYYYVVFSFLHTRMHVHRERYGHTRTSHTYSQMLIHRIRTSSVHPLYLYLVLPTSLTPTHTYPRPHPPLQNLTVCYGIMRCGLPALRSLSSSPKLLRHFTGNL